MPKQPTWQAVTLAAATSFATVLGLGQLFVWMVSR